MTRTLLTSAALCALALAALALYPAGDLDAARLFFVPPDRFIGDTPLGTIARYTAWTLPFVMVAGAALAGLGGLLGLVPPRFAPRPRAALFMVLTFALSPGLLVYGTFKPLAHRPRPHSVTDFGGPDLFRPFTRFDGACLRSCSFPSGETAGSMWTLAPASLVPPPWRGPAVGAALAFGAGTGLLRMAFGGHFLSDVLAAALFTLLAILAARRLLKP